MNPPVHSEPPDLGAALQAPFSDPQWLSKAAILGLLQLVPIVGLLILMGWCRDIYHRARRGEGGLPDLDFSRQLGDGVAPMVAMMNSAIPIFGLTAGFGAIVAVVVMLMESSVNSEAVVAMLSMAGLAGWLIVIGLTVASYAVIPELLRRGFNGEHFPLFSPGASMLAIRSHGGGYALTVIGIFVSFMVSSLGVLACYVGMFITMPLGYAMMAHLLGQWDRMVRGGEHALADAFR